ncbi:MAG: class I SAM-dependent methyltransferase, partial [Bacteroidia bacterium]
MEDRYYHTKESVTKYIQAAKGFDGKNNIEKLKNVLATNSKLLELGSGPGSDFKILNKQYQVTGSDYSIEFVQHLNSTYPNDPFLQLNAATIDTDQKFDGIYSNKVLHHLTDD